MPTFCAHLGYLYRHLPPADRPAAAAADGFAWVEQPDPYAMGVDAFADAVSAAGLRVAQVAAPAGDAARGEKGFACLPGRDAAFDQSLADGLDAAARLCCTLHMMPGLLPDGETRDSLRALYVARLARAARAAEARGVTVLIEPIDDGAVPGFYMNDPAFAAAVLREIAHPSLRLLLDVYHAANRGHDLPRLIAATGDLIAHVQIADAPGRHEPGTGRIDFDAVFGALDAAGYAGVVGLEYVPSGDTSEGLAWRDRHR